MIQTSLLKTLLSKRGPLLSFLQDWVKTNAIQIAIEGPDGNLLFGEFPSGQFTTHNVVIEDMVLGKLYGDPVYASFLSGVLSIMVVKELERKKLGNEVLQLYQELNVIYNFSEKLSETIDDVSIAKLTIDQAMHSLPSDSGLILVWDDQTKKLTIPARSDTLLIDDAKLMMYKETLLDIGLGGQSEIIGDLTDLKQKGIIHEDVQSLIYAAMKVKHRILGAIVLLNKEAEKYTAAHLKLLVTLALQSSAALEAALLYKKNINEVKEREDAILKIHEVTKKFVPNEFIRSLGKENITDVKLGDQVKKIVTVLFTDIRDFTTLSEKMSPEENFRFVSSFNERLGPVIRSHFGFINQYLGDSIMAIFPRNPDDALSAAIEMQKEITKLNVEREAKGLAPVVAGIGMHTGPLIMGITGDASRLDAATISDTVNTAARIESLTKYYKSSLLVSEDTLLYIPDSNKYHFRNLGKVILKGKNNSLCIMECLDAMYESDFTIRSAYTSDFNEAISSYQNHKFEYAASVFKKLSEVDPSDTAVLVFLNRCLKYAEEGPPESWSGSDEIFIK